MNTNQMRSKIQMPGLPTPVLHRETLVRALADAMQPADASRSGPYRIILLCAPAGYGKTTLLIDTVQRFSLTCCWYCCDASDTPWSLLADLLACLRTRFPAFGAHLDTLFASGEQDQAWEPLLEAVLAALHSEISQRFVLVLSDYHKVNQNAAITALVNRLLERFPSRGQMVIESRSLPNLELAVFIAHRQLFALGSIRLRFTPQELYAFAHLQGASDFSLQQAELLTDAFEGWIAGTLLGSELGYTQLAPLVAHNPQKQKWGARPLLSGHRQQISLYITGEVFAQEQALYEFLKAVSIFDQLVPDYCNELLEINDAAERLAYAEQQGLFVAHGEERTMPEQAGVYVCHPIIRELLRGKLRQETPDLYRTYHRQAAFILQRHQEQKQAVLHALLAQEYPLAIELMLPLASDLIDQGEVKTVADWLDLFPRQVLKQDPWLALLQVSIYLARNEYALVPVLLEEVEALLASASSAQENARTISLQVELRLARSKFLSSQGEAQSALACCQQALHLLPADQHQLRRRVYQRLGVCLIVGNGQLHEGIVQFQQALQLSMVPQDERQIATISRLLASAYSWMGNYVLANYHQERALEIWEKLHEPWGITNSLTGMGLLKLRQGLTDEAEEVLVRALHVARDIYHFVSGEAYALSALGELFCTNADYIHALKYLEDALRLAKQCEDRYLIHCTLCSLATTYLFMGELQTAQFFLNQVSLKEQEDQSYEGIFYHLTQGRVFLAQKREKQAQKELERASSLAERASIQFLYVRAILLLGALHLRIQRGSDARRCIEQVMEVNKKGAFAYDVKMEMERYPELRRYLEQAEAAALQTVAPPEQAVTTWREVSSAANGLEILAFGDPQLVIDGEPVTRWHLTRSLELFFLLLERGRPVQKEQLIEILWPNAVSDQIDTTVRTAIYYLRRVIGKSCVVYRSGLYSLDMVAGYGTQVWYDVALFEEHYAQAKKALQERDAEQATSALTRMVGLYRGSFLQSFYNDWCIPRRDSLQRTYMDARHQLAMLAERREAWEESLSHWQQLLLLDSCSEEAHYGVMNCYAHMGKRKLALQQYQLCTRQLQEELHIKPGQRLQQLYQELLRTRDMG